MIFNRGLPVSPPKRSMHILKLSDGRAYVGVACPDASQWVSVRTHYCVDAQRRVICPGSSCRCLGKGVGWALDDRTYVPCLCLPAFHNGDSFEVASGATWSTVLITFTPHCFEDATIWSTGRPFVIRRGGGRKNGPVIVSRFEHELVHPMFKEWYPVVETLEKTFGIRGD